LRSKKYIEHKGNKFNLYTEFGDQWAQREYTVAVTDNGPEILAGVR
jgi:methionine aminopeptidase